MLESASPSPAATHDQPARPIPSQRPAQIHLKIDLDQNLIVSRSRARGVLQRTLRQAHPKALAFDRLARALWGNGHRPADLDRAIKRYVFDARRALRPLQFTVEIVPPDRAIRYPQRYPSPVYGEASPGQVLEFFGERAGARSRDPLIKSEERALAQLDAKALL
jgi:hypothetical protein